jgi:hypothetical protein
MIHTYVETHAAWNSVKQTNFLHSLVRIVYVYYNSHSNRNELGVSLKTQRSDQVAETA